MLRIRFPFALGTAVVLGLTAGSAALAQNEQPEEKPAPPAAENADVQKEAEEQKPADEKKAAEDKAAADKKAADEKKAAADKKAADEKKAAEMKAAEEKKAADAKKAADDKKAAEEKKAPAVETVSLVTNLENPSGLAIQEKTGHILIATKFGVYRYDPKGHAISLEIVGYPTDVYGKGPKYDIGPLGLGFAGEYLVVGDGSRPDGEELVRAYKLGDAALKEPMKEDKAEITLGPIKEGAETASGEKATKPEGNFYDVAVGKNAIFVTSNGDDTKGWIHKIEIKDGKPADKMVPTLATKEDSQVDAPVPVEFNKDKTELYVGQMGEITLPNDSLLLIYDPETGEMKKKLELGLHDPAGMAFSPKTGKLYVTDFAWAKPEDGGLFEVTIDGDTVKTNKIVSLDKPTAIEFDADGKLYVTVISTADPNAKTKDGEPLSAGKLLVIDAGL